jgi:hypothetical protein
MVDQNLVAHRDSCCAGAIARPQRRQRPFKLCGIDSSPVSGAVKGEIAAAAEIDLELPEDCRSAGQRGSYVADGTLPKFWTWKLGVHHEAPDMLGVWPETENRLIGIKVPSRRASPALSATGSWITDIQIRFFALEQQDPNRSLGYLSEVHEYPVRLAGMIAAVGRTML